MNKITQNPQITTNSSTIGDSSPISPIPNLQKRNNNNNNEMKNNNNDDLLINLDEPKKNFSKSKIKKSNNLPTNQKIYELFGFKDKNQQQIYIKRLSAKSGTGIDNLLSCMVIMSDIFRRIDEEDFV